PRSVTGGQMIAAGSFAQQKKDRCPCGGQRSSITVAKEMWLPKLGRAYIFFAVFFFLAPFFFAPFFLAAFLVPFFLAPFFFLATVTSSIKRFRRRVLVHDDRELLVVALQRNTVAPPRRRVG